MRHAMSMVLVTAICITLVAGCSDSANTSYSANTRYSADSLSGDNATQNPTQKETAKENKLQPITFKFYNADPKKNPENFESPVAKVIKEKTGVTLDMGYQFEDNKQKISIMVASGDYPDLIYAKEEQNRLVLGGALIDLTDMIEQRGDNIKKLYGKYLKRLRYSLEDKSIYFLGAFGIDDQDIEPPTGFQLQHEVVKELGYPELRTLNDYENAIKAYKEKHPTIDGQPTIGMSMCADGWKIMISVTNPAAFATGQNGDDGEWYIDQKTNKAVLHLTRPEEKEYFRWLNHMYNTGLLDPECFIQKYDQYAAKIASGRVLGLSDAVWQYSQPEFKLKQDGKYERMYGIYPLTLNEDFTNNAFHGGGYDAGWGIGITKSCRDPQRAFDFLNWMAGDEAQILNNWGIEGVNYQIVDGKRVISEEEWKRKNSDAEYSRKTGIGAYTYPFPEYGKLVKDPTGQYYKPEFPEKIMAQYSGIEKEVLDAYGVKMWRDLFKLDYEPKKYGFGWKINLPIDSHASILYQKIQEISWRRIPQAVLSKPKQFDKIWDSYQKELVDAGVHKMEDEFNKLLADRVKLWNE